MWAGITRAPKTQAPPTRAFLTDCLRIDPSSTDWAAGLLVAGDRSRSEAR